MTRLDATALALVRSVAFGTGSDGRLLLASAGDDATVRLWDPPPVPLWAINRLELAAALAGVYSLHQLC